MASSSDWPRDKNSNVIVFGMINLEDCFERQMHIRAIISNDYIWLYNSTSDNINLQSAMKSSREERGS